MAVPPQKTNLDEGYSVKGGVNKGAPTTPRPPAPKGQGGNQGQNLNKK